MKKNVFFVAAIFAALCLNSCDKNDPDNPKLSFDNGQKRTD